MTFEEFMDGLDGPLKASELPYYKEIFNKLLTMPRSTWQRYAEDQINCYEVGSSEWAAYYNIASNIYT